MRRRRLVLFLSAIIMAGCGSAAVHSPRSALAQLGTALRDGDAERTWAMLDADARRGRDAQGHASLFAANRDELRDVGQSVLRTADRAGVRATVRLASGEQVRLVLEDGAWRIEGGVLDAVALTTPLDAVGAFRRALLRRDLPGLERVLARQTHAEWQDEIRRLLEATADPDDLEVELEGNRARVRTTGGGAIELVRESGEWHVVDVRPPP